MYKDLTDKELDVSYAIGVIEAWLEREPQSVRDYFQEVVDGVTFYRDKYLAMQEDVTSLTSKYSQLTAQTAVYLQKIQEQDDQIKELLIETQRDLHKKEPE